MTRNRTILSLLIAATIAAASLFPAKARAAANVEIGWSGRLTEVDGRPVTGPVDLEFAAFRAAEGGSDVWQTTMGNVPLFSGVFSVRLSFSAAEFAALFGSPGSPVFIETRDNTHGEVYPRQQFLSAPTALRVPVDEKSLAFNTAGKLSLAAAPEAGKFLGADAGGKIVWMAPGGTGDMTQTEYGGSAAGVVKDSERLGGQLPSYYLNPASLTAGLPLTKIAVASCIDGQVLKISGGSWNCATDDSSVGTVKACILEA